jgi:DNA topoisomerase-1
MRGESQLKKSNQATDGTPPLEEIARADAKEAGLLYVTGAEPGYCRVRVGKSFSYRDTNGRKLKDKDDIARVKKLAIPPAWTDVWICASPRGHIQATGRDARGRKQYRYHERWRATRDATKFDRILDFAQNLPALRERVLADLRRPGLPREKVLATIVYLLENTLVRVGNEEYARTNKSYGLTTLRDRHVAVQGSALRFNFMGKSGKEWKLTLTDRRVAKIVRACQELPGQHLFQYIDENGERQKVGSADLNGYLREIAGSDVTAKDFRTWAATVLAGAALSDVEAEGTAKGNGKQVVAVVKQVAEQLGNTPAICRQAYIHPEILVSASELELEQPRRRLNGLAKEEAAVLAYLEEARERNADSP